MLEQLGVSPEGATWTARANWGGVDIAGAQVTEPRPIFPRLEPPSESAVS
jgi:hypothetical protein